MTGLSTGTRLSIASLALALLLFSPTTTSAETIDSRAANTPALVAPDLPPPPSAVGALDAVARDGDLLGSFLTGSNAVRQRADMLRAKAAKLSKRERKVLTAFRRTQKGTFDPRIADAAEEWSVDPFLLKGLLYTESRFESSLVGRRIYKKVRGKRRVISGGARGIAQFTGAGISAVNETRQRRHARGHRVFAFTSADVMDPYLAIDAAAELLASYIDRFGFDGGVTAYNSGPYGGKLVQKLGFARAKRRLRKVGHTRLQGYRFLTKVLRETRRLHKKAGLGAFEAPNKERRRKANTRKGKKKLDRAKARRKRPNT
jgi:soluble lytic murein transglycosylase-like protein